MNIVELKEGVERLPIQERASFAKWILASLDSLEDNNDIAWRQEVRSRINEIKTGQARMIHSDKMWSELLSDYDPTS